MKNAAKNDCYEKVARTDSALYYSLRKVPYAERDLVVAIHAFYREIEDILWECEDHELALLKLNWYRCEVLKLATEKPTHPVMIFLQENMKDFEKIQNRLLKIIDGFEQYSIPDSFKTFEDVVIYWMKTAGERELLLNEILQSEMTISAEIIYQFMLLIEIVNYIQYLRLYVRHGWIYFSIDELKRFQVTEDMLREYVTTEQIQQLLQYQVAKVEKAYAAIKKLSKKERAALSYLIVRAEIARVTLQEIQKSDFKVLENLICLTPLRYGWIVFCN